jgi:hypothetical protein
VAETVIFKNESAILKYHSEGIVHHEFLTRMVGKDFRDILMRGYEQMKKTGATRWLSDDRKHTVLDEADMAWGQTEWFPKVAALGWRYWAIVNPERLVGQMQMKNSAKTFQMMGNVEVRFFAQPGEALAWLKSVGNEPLKKTA